MSDLARIAHRGYADDAPENTLSAVRAAIPRADGIEVDVRRCADDLVVIHDATVDRVTDAAGRVAAFSAAALGDLSVAGTDAGVPRLRAVVEAVPADTTLHLELKERGCAAAALAVADRAGHDDVVVSSFDPAILREARAVAPDVARAYLFAETPRTGVAVARDLDCTFVHPDATTCLGSDVVAHARAADLGVNAWTVTAAATVGALAERGVDGVIADTAGAFDPTSE